MSNISVCIITKNEESNLKKCLEAIAPYPFEVIVVDTGSTDGTRQIAIDHGAHVYDFEWIKDFSAARNFSISKASNDWILVLDSDEFVTTLDYDALIRFQTEHPTSIGRLTRTSPDAKNNKTIDHVERFFNRKVYHYERPIHEQVTPIENILVENVTIPVSVDHCGYISSELLDEKAARNNEILFSYLENHPDDIYTYFQIGQSFFMLSDFNNAIFYFEKALSYDLVPDAEYVQMLVTDYGYSLLFTNQIEKATLFFEQIYTLFENYADFVFLMGCCYIRMHEYLKAIPQYVRCLTLTDYKTDGVTTYLPLYNLGLIYDEFGQKEMAENFYKKAAPNYEPALNKLKSLQKEF